MLDPRTGEVLALASTPTYDASAISNPATSQAAFEALQNDPGQPLLPRATLGRYVPGSVFKIVTAIAGLASGAIPLGARVFAVADSFDAMTSDRPYRGSIGAERALAELRNGAGTQFDPAIVRVFVDMVESDPPKDDEDFEHALKHAG